MGLGFALSSLPILLTHFSPQETQGKPISYSSRGKKMRKKNVLVSDVQTIFSNQLFSDHRIFSKSK